MAINPYQIAQSALGLREAEHKSKQTVGTGMLNLAVQKGKMTREFEEEISRAQLAAEGELRKEMRKSQEQKALGGLGTILGFVPGWGAAGSAALGGVTTGDITRAGGKFAEKQANLAQTRALGISDKWKNTFLGGRLKDYETKQKSYYQDLIDKAGVSKSDILSSALTSGVGSFAAGKVMGKLTEGIQGMEAFKKMLPGKHVSGEQVEKLLEKIDTFEPSISTETVKPFVTGPEGIPIYDPSQAAAIKAPYKQLKMKYPELTKNISDPKLKKLLAGVPEKLEGYDISKLVDAKLPMLNALWQSLGVGTEEVGAAFGKDSAFMSGLLLLLSQSESLLNK